MRPLAILLVAAALFCGVYFFFARRMPTSDAGTAPTQAISLTGVRMDLLEIAKAERSSIALGGHCLSIDELIASNSLTFSRPERDGYSYSSECSGTEFRIFARHPASDVAGIRFPALVIDQTQQIREVD
jgi:hypothetical protein